MSLDKLAKLTLMSVTDVAFRGKDLTGYISAKLAITGLVGRKVYPGGSQVYVWLADCSCGLRGIRVNGQHFLNGGTKSCGCLAKERSSETKLYNHLRSKAPRTRTTPIRFSASDVLARGREFQRFSGRYGSLTVLSLSHGVLYWTPGTHKLQRHLVTHWTCVCDCGAVTTRSSSYLYKKVEYKACHKCIRLHTRSQPEVL